MTDADIDDSPHTGQPCRQCGQPIPPYTDEPWCRSRECDRERFRALPCPDEEYERAYSRATFEQKERM
jgi:hypothetical protein